MIKPTGLTTPTGCGEPGTWLRDYVDEVSKTAFPLSFHILNAYFGLSSIIGRHAALRLDGFTLYPPVFIFLLGRSGVGKGQSMNLMRDLIIRPAAERIPGFTVMDPHQFTSAGIIKGFEIAQANSGLDMAEGAVTVDEASAVFTSRVGTENMDEFIIKAHERKDIESFTKMDGQLVVKNFTAGFAFGSTVGKIRHSMNAEAFGGGLMHRFLIAHELEQADHEGADVDQSTMAKLSSRALEIRHRAPTDMGIEEDAVKWLRAQARAGRNEALTNEEMSGYYNRRHAIIAQLGITRALAEDRNVIKRSDLMETFNLLNALVLPLQQLVKELRFGTQQQVLFQLAESIHHLGPKGMEMKEFKSHIPASTPRALKDGIEFLKELDLIWIGTKGDKPWVWRSQVVGTKTVRDDHDH